MKNCGPLLVAMQLSPKLDESYQVLALGFTAEMQNRPPPKILAAVGGCVSPLAEYFI
jgi:hypothetical protein